LKTNLTRYLLLCVLSLAFGPRMLAQQTAPPTPSPSQQPPPPAPSTTSQPQSESPKQKTEEEKQIERKEQSQRILGVVPQFSVTNRMNAPPLTPGEKFHLFVKSAFDPATIGTVGLQAGVSQAEDEFPEYGQGAQGYGKRFGASLADEVSSGFFSNYFYSTLLKEDPRYFRLGEGSFMHRLTYSVVQEFVCHTDNGGKSFSFQNAFGAVTAGGISNIYYPSSDRGFGLTMSRSGIALLYGSVGGIVDEFWPDISHRLFRRHSGQPKEDANPN
jgi:hypothetical protein